MADPQIKRETGTVLWFDAHRGYGFIRPELGGVDVFVHGTQIKRAGIERLEPGMRLAFEIRHTQRQRPKAINLEPIAMNDLTLKV